MISIHHSKYLDFLCKFGVGGAHPGGINLTKEIFLTENINKTSHVLDVGCGTGQTAAYLVKTYGAHVTGIDINPIMVEKAKERMKKERLPVEIFEGSIEQIPLQDSTFDLIICESVLSFVDAPNALKEMVRLLKNGGRFIANELIINEQLKVTIEKEIKEFYGFKSILQEKEWIALLKQAGFQHIRIQKKHPLEQSHSIPEYHYSKNIEPELYEIMEQHVEMTIKYEGIWDYRIFSCTK